jgi:hypothetical protein
VPGSHNSKREGEPVLVDTLWGSGRPVDLTELEALADLLPDAGMFRRKSNGHEAATRPTTSSSTNGHKEPVNVEQRLAAMALEGAGDSAIHPTQVTVTAALLREGMSLDETIITVLDATQKAVTGDPRACNWNWAKEERAIRGQCLSFIKKNPELAYLLPIEERPADPNDQVIGATTKKLSLQPFVPFDLASLPPREWLYGQHYQRRTVSATVAPGGFGKTTLCMVEAVAMATARDLLGEQPTARLRVWYHNGEDSLEELHRRIGAICLHYGVPQEELEGWLFPTSGAEVPLRVAQGHGDLKIDAPLVQLIKDEILANKIDVAILDPLVTLHSVPEQDNTKMDTVVRIFAAIADTQDCAVELAHHTRKLAAGATDYGGDDMRGASATKDAVRAARVLNQMTTKEAETAGIEGHERHSYFRVDTVKRNNAPPSRAVWRRFLNVLLPNTDYVGVVVPWAFPGQEAPSAEMTAAERRQPVHGDVGKAHNGRAQGEPQLRYELRP